MQVSDINGVKVYNLSVGKSLPEWISDSKRRLMLKNDIEMRKRVQLIQDFEMPNVSNCVVVTRDQHSVIAAGTYKPRLRVYDTANVSMKFEQGLDYEPLKVIALAEDWTKLAILQSERQIEFQHSNGHYYRVRTPKPGRDMVYDTGLCDLVVAAVGSDVYRLNLEIGAWRRPLKLSCKQSYCVDINSYHGLTGVGCDSSVIELFDPRVPTQLKAVSTLDVSTKVDEVKSGDHISSIKFGPDALTLAAGTSAGQIVLFDLRAAKPRLVKDHNYELPIRTIGFHNGSGDGQLVASLDKRCFKIWNKESGQSFTTIEPGPALTSFTSYAPDSGLFFMANEAPKILTFFIPSLGPAPRWCWFLDSLTEELEEEAGGATTAIYDDYKFVSRDQLRNLSLDHLIGTNLLRAYMHGYFIDMRLYKKASVTIEPKRGKPGVCSPEEKSLPASITVNHALASRLEQSAAFGVFDHSTVSTDHSTVSKRAELLNDTRFSNDLFRNPDFHIDETEEGYQQLSSMLFKMDRKAAEKKARKSTKSTADDSSDDEVVYTKPRKSSDLEKISTHVYEATSDDEQPLPVETTKKFDPTTKKFDPTTKKFDPTTKKFDPTTKKFDPTTKKVDPTTKKVDPTTKKFDPTTKKFDPTTKKVDPTTKKFDPRSILKIYEKRQSKQAESMSARLRESSGFGVQGNPVNNEVMVIPTRTHAAKREAAIKVKMATHRLERSAVRRSAGQITSNLNNVRVMRQGKRMKPSFNVKKRRA